MTEKDNAIYEFEKMATWSDKYTTEELQAINYARKILHSEFVIIPKGATNGDVIKMMFPSCEKKERMSHDYFEMYFDANIKNPSYMRVSKDWWNSPYKTEVYRGFGDSEPLDFLKETLEKQIPKIPAYEGDGYDLEGNIIFDEWLCPCCGTRCEVYYDKYDYCPKCGQKLDWSEEE